MKSLAINIKSPMPKDVSVYLLDQDCAGQLPDELSGLKVGLLQKVEFELFPENVYPEITMSFLGISLAESSIVLNSNITIWVNGFVNTENSIVSCPKIFIFNNGELLSCVGNVYMYVDVSGKFDLKLDTKEPLPDWVSSY